MKKFILLLIALAGLAFLEPRSRAQITKVFTHVSDARHERSTMRALKQIALDVQRTEARTGSHPQPARFGEWLRQSDRGVHDPWGSEYYLELFPDSFVVGSAGPDYQRRTADDLRHATRREATAAGLGSTYTTPPTPPSSGVKSSATRAAEAARKKNNQ